MWRMFRLLKVLALAAALAGSPAWAQAIRINPVPPHVKPQWIPVPGAPGVSYAPNLPTDVFRYKGKYYFFWEGYLYKGNKPSGPWKTVTEVPGFFYQIDPAYFKTAKKEGTGAPPATAAPSEAAPAAPAPETPPAESSPAPHPEAATPAAPAQPEAVPGEAPKAPKVM